jgi:hypothetical protein
LSHNLTSFLNNVHNKPRIATGTATIAAMSPPGRPDLEDAVVVDVGLRVEVGVGLVVLDISKPGVADVAGTLHQLPSRKMAINLPMVEVGLEASLSLVTVNTVPPSTQ